MKYFAKSLTTMAVILACTPFAAIADDDDDGDESEYKANLVPLNDSGVYAEVELELEGKKLKVSIEASGLEAGKPHPQHIHGFGDASANSTCPTSEADANGDGVVSVGEGLPNYGPIVLPLFPFDLVDASGNLDYEATFTVNPSSLQPLHKRTIVMHGLTVAGSYVPSTPIACGELSEEDDD